MLRRAISPFSKQFLLKTSVRHMQSSAIHAVIFDCGGVLAEDCPVKCFEHLATRYAEAERSRIADMHKRNYQCWNRFKLDPSYTEAMYWKDIIKNESLHESADQMKAFLRDSLQPYPDVLDAAKTIAQDGKVIGIMSNHSEEWFQAIWDKFNLGSIFLNRDLVVVSQAVGAAKPDMKIMDIMLSRLRAVAPELQPQQVLFIDDKKNNVDAAKRFGFQSIEFDASEEAKASLWQKLEMFNIFPK